MNHFHAKLIATWTVLGSTTAFAQPPVTPATAASGLDHEQQIRRLSDADLKVLYLRCAKSTEHHRLMPDEVMQCSIGYDALLNRVFEGNYDALRTWSAEASGPPATAYAD